MEETKEAHMKRITEEMQKKRLDPEESKREKKKKLKQRLKMMRSEGCSHVVLK